MTLVAAWLMDGFITRRSEMTRVTDYHIRSRAGRDIVGAGGALGPTRPAGRVPRKVTSHPHEQTSRGELRRRICESITCPLLQALNAVLPAASVCLSLEAVQIQESCTGCSGNGNGRSRNRSGDNRKTL
jgi:hypothetical protein